ncbi:hypothetical protein COLO4_20570 [Corchorus olitorius]|uniref:Uncharacterized protein n=1 Tax=Corchorus olitorius TaxID=93759 RepID=A0A1R3IZ09_9ROSI|nr:hypothetical protein COLO4_20570 [Corchorus olitorius]
MNTKTMRLPPRRVSNSIPNNNKRKERDDFDLKHLTPPPTKWLKPAVPLAGSGKAAQPVLSNQLLAGYLAHEFLTRGTLFGQAWDPTRAQPTAVESRKEEIKEEAEASERSKADGWGPHTGDRQPEPARSLLADVRLFSDTWRQLIGPSVSFLRSLENQQLLTP